LSRSPNASTRVEHTQHRIETFNVHERFPTEARHVIKRVLQMHSSGDQHTKKKFRSDPLSGVSRLIFVDALGAL
jgi:hypothetical protein